VWIRKNKLWLSPLLVLLILSVLVRVGVAIYLGDTIEEVRGGTSDQISYDLLAQRVAGGHGFSFDRNWWPYARANQPTAFWSYLYTLYLAGTYLVVGHHPLVARLLQAVIAGILLPWLMYRIGCRSFGRRTGLITAAIGAIYLYFVLYAASLMTEMFYIVAILWSVDAAMRLAARIVDPGSGKSARGSYWLLSLELGLAMAIALLLRQVIVAFFIVLALWLLWMGWRAARVRKVLLSLLVAGTALALVVLPWIVRNYSVFQQLAMPNTNTGFAFFWGNHPIYGKQFEAVLSPEHGVSYQQLIPPELRELNEAALDRALLARGLAFVFDDPERYVLLSLSRIPAYFIFWPTAESTLLSNAARVLSFGLFLPFMVYGLFLALRRLPKLHVPAAERRQPADSSSTSSGYQGDLRFEYIILFVLFIVVYTLVHLASWANPRYRLPVDAFLILFAAYAIDSLLDKVLAFRNRQLDPARS
jgi:4-amino-4-deoxy-L-arabinose transferase-like glycosyltransferase